MSRVAIAMSKLAEILRLKHDCGKPHRVIAESVSVSIGAVSNVLRKARQLGVGWPLPAPAGGEVDFAQAARELGRKGVTRQLLWEQYCGQGYARSFAAI